ncbi:MAG TPA: glycine oxidase ThiO [Rhizomicrobium sp.]|nr:glycine oxidase ThiO [Rhizomicrobium sp.]
MKVVVIGGGIAGLSIGWRLAQAGAQVTVVERAQPGGGATLASAGMIAPTAERVGVESPEAKFARAAAALWPAFAAEVEQASNHKVTYRPDGTILVARTAAEAQDLAARVAAVPGCQILTAGDARALEPLLEGHIEFAVFDPAEAQVDNRAIGLALARAFVRAGGVLQSNETIVRLEVMPNGALAAVSPFASYKADAIVVAAGAWAGRIETVPPGLAPPVIPVKGEMIALTPDIASGFPRRVIWGHEVYLVPRHGRLFVGATMARVGYDTALTQGAVGWLRSRAEALMPALAQWEEAEHWAGLRPGTPDDLPILGETAVPGLYVAGGQFRNGILLAPAMAEALSSLILERRSTYELSAFDPRRFNKTLVDQAETSR